MSLNQLLQECGGYDDGAGSDMDVCIGNDSPPAPPAGSASAPPAGSTSAPLAGSTSSSLPQEDQAQGAGDDADHPVDVDSSPHNQSADVSVGDGAIRNVCALIVRTRVNIHRVIVIVTGPLCLVLLGQGGGRAARDRHQKRPRSDCEG